MRLHRVGAVARRPAAVAAGEGLVEARVASGLDVEAAEARLAHHSLRPRGHPLRQRGEERAEEHLDEPGVRLPAADDGGRPPRVRDGALGCLDGDQAVEAVVDGEVGVDQALEGVGAGGEGHRVGRVDRRAPLWVRARRVEVDALGADRDARPQAHRLGRVAVVVDEALGLVRAEREPGELAARAPLGVVEQLAHRRHDRVAAVALDERLDAADAGRVGGDLGAEVAGRLVLRADLRQDELEDVGHDLPAVDELHRRDDHALLEDLAEGADARRRAAADVDVVGDVGDVAEELAARVDGRDQADVVQVHAARERVVRQQHVAGSELPGAVLEDRLRHLLDHRAEVHRLGEPLRDRAEPGVEERRREVRARLDVGRVRAPLQRQHHLVGRRHERVPDHLEADRIDPDGAHARPSRPGPSTPSPGPYGQGTVTVTEPSQERGNSGTLREKPCKSRGTLGTCPGTVTVPTVTVPGRLMRAAPRWRPRRPGRR